VCEGTCAGICVLADMCGLCVVDCSEDEVGKQSCSSLPHFSHARRARGQVSLRIVRARTCVRDTRQLDSFGNGDVDCHLINRDMCLMAEWSPCSVVPSFAIGTLEYTQAHPRYCIKDLVWVVCLARVEWSVSTRIDNTMRPNDRCVFVARVR
jgi:hypothetical protein